MSVPSSSPSTRRCGLVHANRLQDSAVLDHCAAAEPGVRCLAGAGHFSAAHMLTLGFVTAFTDAIGFAGAGFSGVGEVRAGKILEIELAETDPAKAKAAAEDMARKLLANTVIESFKVELAQ